MGRFESRLLNTEATHMLELHLEFTDGGRRAYAEHSGFERAALVGLYFWLQSGLSRTSAGTSEMRYFNGPQGEAIPVYAESVRRMELRLDGQDVGNRVRMGEMP